MPPADPSKNGEWIGNDGKAGVRGEARFISEDSRVKKVLDEKGLNGVDYKNGMPDFSPFAIGEVQIENMTDDRNKNFEKADRLLAEKWSTPEKTWTPDEVKAWRKKNKYTWHELNDMETMQLVPSCINHPVFKHLGGVGEYNLESEDFVDDAK